MITLYHGSNVEIVKIDLTLGQKNKDFGQGFYLTDIYEQAFEMAKRRVKIVSLQDENDGHYSPIVTKFSFDEQAFSDPSIKSKRFESATAEWAEFIAKNRYATKNGFLHDYDIVYGPVANDGVYDQLRRFIQGRITSQELAEELKYTNLNNQYYFGSEKALDYLKKI